MQNLFLFILFLTTTCSYGQEKNEKITSQAEQFSAVSGTLIEKKFIDIGKVKGVSIQVMKLKDLNSGESISALRFEYEYRASYTSISDTKIAHLDLDEIDGLIKSMKNIKTTVFPSIPTIYTEVTFTSRTGFKAGAYYDMTKAKWFTYVKLEKFDSDSRVFLNVEDFDLILSFVENAKTKM